MKDGDKDIPKDQWKDLTVKAVLLSYLQAAHLLGVKTDGEKLSAYLAGLAIGSGGAYTELDQPQYDVLKKIVDCNVLTSQGENQDLFGIVVHQQIKKIIDNAETVVEE